MMRRGFGLVGFCDEGSEGVKRVVVRILEELVESEKMNPVRGAVVGATCLTRFTLGARQFCLRAR